MDEIREHDVVVVGAGVAGLTAALSGAARPVAVLTKTPLGGGGASLWAQGGIAAAVGEGDSPHLHAADTVAAGAGLVDPLAAELLAAEGARRIRLLLEIGAAFDRDARGELALGREAAHSRRRVLHARDATGAEIVRALVAAVRGAPEIEVFDDAFARDLLVEEGRVTGVVARHPGGAAVLHRAPAVVLATGGLGRLYERTTNPPEATGDGLAMAARAGARLVDVEFVQFHPTALDTGADPMPLLTEALRGEGALLLDEGGRRFMGEEHELAELAPRDVVARAIWHRLAAGGRVFLDAREAVGEAFPERFPTVFELCREVGIDPRREPVPVAPAAHYHMGGVAVDLRGRASLPGLWACGEVASTGVHGANRLASNSLLEALVFGARVAEDIAARRRELPPPVGGRPSPPLPPHSRAPAPEADEEAAVVADIRRLMWQHAGLVRHELGLRRALKELESWRGRLPPGAGEAANLHLAARLVARSALLRRESRGGHYRSDHPHPDPRWRRRLFVTAATGETPAVLPARAGRAREAR